MGRCGAVYRGDLADRYIAKRCRRGIEYPGYRRGDGQDAVDVAHGAVEGELADEERVLDRLGPRLLRGDEHAHGDGQVVGRPSLADVGRGQVDGDALAGENQDENEDKALCWAADFRHTIDVV